MEQPKPLVYVAGPITKPEVYGNVNAAVAEMRQLLADGYVVPFMPQLSVLAAMIAPDISYEDWLAYDFDVIRRCQAVYRLHGESAGADREVHFADSIGVPTFYGRTSLYAWAIEHVAGRVA